MPSRGSFKLKKLSVALFPLNLGGSNAARLELEAIFTPPYNAARYGFSLTSSPAQADIVLIIGSGTAKIAEHALRLLATMPDEVKLVLLGSEAISGGAYRRTYGVVGPVVNSDSNSKSELKLPVGKRITAYIAGSPPDPQSIIDAILKICEN